MAWLVPSVIKLWYIIGSLAIPPMLLPLLAVYFKPILLPPKATFAVMVISCLISGLSFAWGVLHQSNGVLRYPFGLEPFFPGLSISVLSYGFINLRKDARFFGKQK
jgi:SSS family solute:Na+ symporter